MFADSIPLKFSQKYFCFALARSVYYLGYLKRGANIHRKTFTTLLKTVKVKPSESFHVSGIMDVFLQDTCSAEKNELLFSKFGINYNNLPQLYRKGTTLIWQSARPKEAEETQPADPHNTTQTDSRPAVKKQIKPEVVVLNVDIIGEQFWKEHSHILS